MLVTASVQALHVPVAYRHNPVVELIARFDDIGFDVGRTHISVLGGIIVLMVLIGVIVCARFGSRLARLGFARFTHLDRTQQLLGEKIVSIAVWTLSILVGIDILKIDLTALTVFSGAFGLAIGFGLQKTFGNLIAGIILLMDRSIKPGDVIAVGTGKDAAIGQVMKIGIRAVSVTTRDKIEYLIPNENLMTSQVENWSYSSRDVRVKVPVGVAYDTDIVEAEQLMLEAAKNCKRILEHPAPTVWLNDFGNNSINFTIMCWINDPEEGVGNVRSEVLKKLWQLFRDHGVEFSSPTQIYARQQALAKPGGAAAAALPAGPQRKA
jgi:small-conductance mechanosensitive channel